jgi:hypothetical protein
MAGRRHPRGGDSPARRRWLGASQCAAPVFRTYRSIFGARDEDRLRCASPARSDGGG